MKYLIIKDGIITNIIVCDNDEIALKFNAVPYYKGANIGLKYEPVIEIPEPSVEDQIASLKAQLSSTDYKIIKCSEAQLLGEELPYDIASLHTERQALRDKINELEAELEAELENTLENNQEGGAI